VSLVIVLILVVLWLVVLAPGLIRRLLERRSGESIESFHHGLHLLERTGPNLVTPAFRLETAHAETGLAPGQSGYPAISSVQRRPNLTLLPGASPNGMGPGRAGHHSARRRAARRRRRDLLAILVATFVLTGSLGLVHSLHVLWVITAFCGIAIAGLIGLAAYAQALAMQGAVLTRAEASYQSEQAGRWEDEQVISGWWTEDQPYDADVGLNTAPIAVAR
jgi:hypothetical protein